jgi:colicin import membrane protein
MLKELRHHPRALALAVAVHVALIAALVVSLDWTRHPAPAAQVETVQAVVMDETKVRAEQERLKEAERKKQEQEEQRLKKLEQEAEQARQAREQEQQRLKQLEQEAEKARREREQEQQRLAELEAQRKAEAERLEKQRQAERLAQEKAKEQKRLADLETRRKIEEEKKRETERRLAEQQLKQQLEAEEQAAVDKARQEQAQSIIAQYTSLIQQKVRRNWLKPASAGEGMSCTVRVRLIPGGQVSDARVVASSGDELFDRSVETAVYKAGPLPLPPDAALFDYFRELDFVFKP